MRINLLSSFLLITILLICGISISADEPLEKPADKTIYSPNQKFGAALDYKDQRITVFAVSKQRKKQLRTKLWEMPGWFYNVALADDGENFIVGYYRRNLLDLNYKPDEIMLSFYHRGELVSQVKLNQLIENFAALPRTDSHFAWLKMFGFDEHGNYSLTTFENCTFLFNPATGIPVNAKLLQPEAAATRENPTIPITSKSNSDYVTPPNSPTDKNTKPNFCFGLLGSLGITALVNFIKSDKK